MMWESVGEYNPNAALPWDMWCRLCMAAIHAADEMHCVLDITLMEDGQYGVTLTRMNDGGLPLSQVMSAHEMEPMLRALCIASWQSPLDLSDYQYQVMRSRLPEVYAAIGGR